MHDLKNHLNRKSLRSGCSAGNLLATLLVLAKRPGVLGSICSIPFVLSGNGFAQVENGSVLQLLKQHHEIYLSRPANLPDRSFVPGFSSGTTPFPIIRVNQDTGEAPQNEPSVRINPKDPNNIVVAFRDFRVSWNPPIRNVTIATTTDAGKTWHEQFAQYSINNRFSDPAVGVDTAGNFYVATLDWRDSKIASSYDASIRKSTDKGMTWLPAIADAFAYDKDMIFVDDCPSSPLSGNVYLAYHGVFGFSRSTDGGLSFSYPRDTLSIYAPTPTTGIHGEIYIAGYEDSLVIRKSLDGGETFARTAPFSNSRAFDYIGIDGTISSLNEPVVAVDKSFGARRGSLYVVWIDEYSGLSCNRSDDGGRTWGGETAVSQGGRSVFHYWMTVDDSGFVDVVFLDRRNDPNNILCDAYFAQSRDGGQTFKNFRITPQNFDPRIYPNTDVRLGEYIGIDARAGMIVPVWVDTRAGNQDICIATIDPRRAGRIEGRVTASSTDGYAGFNVLLNHDNGTDRTLTDSSGHYFFDGLFPGNYDVWEDTRGCPPNGICWRQTYPDSFKSYTVVIESSEVVTGLDFQNSSVSSSFSVLDKWNMVSVPSAIKDSSTSTFFPTAVSPAFGYQGSYVIATKLQPGVGYWLKFNGVQSIRLLAPFLMHDTISVLPGWNMIGSLSTSIPVGNIGSLPTGMTTSKVFEFNGAYHITSAIEPGKGYWIKVDQPGKLILSAVGGIPRTARLRMELNGEIPPLPPNGNETSGNGRTPLVYQLDQNYPNPFNPTTTVRFELPKESHVSLKVFDVLGREVATLVSDKLQPGIYTAQWDASQTPSGVYFYKFTAGEYGSVRKMVVIK